MTREEAIERVKAWNLDPDDMEVLSTVIPELADSDDERIRKELIEQVGYIIPDEEEYDDEGRVLPTYHKRIGRYRDWLEKQKESENISASTMIPSCWEEKQKENSTNADSIPSDCASDTKYEDRWHKVADSLPDNAREVICKDAIGNFFIGRYYHASASWEVMMYDDCDKSNEDNPPVVMWADIPSEKQEEQKPVDKCKGCNNVKGCINCVDGSEWAHIEEKEQKPAEMDNEEIELSDFESELFSAFSDGWQQYLHGEEVDVAQWAKEHSAQLLNAAKLELKPAEYEKPLLSKFEQAVYDCAWGKVTCKPEGETQEEYAKRWAEHLLLMVRDWADDYIDSQIESAKRKAYDKGKTDAEKPAEWSEEDEDNLTAVKTVVYDYFDERYAEELYTWLKSSLPQPKEERVKMLQDICNKGKEISKRIEMLEKKIGLY